MSYPPSPSDPGDPYNQSFQDDPYAQPGPAPGGYAGDPAAGGGIPYGHGPQAGGWQAPYEHGGDAVLTTVGDIAITRTSVVTPAGRLPIKGSTWTVTDMTHTTQGVSQTGIVLTVVSLVIFIWFCGVGVLGLLFLLMKEEKTTGNIQVTVQGDGVYHSTMVPAQGPQTLVQVTQTVNYARSLAAT
ncbi:hypothetical protein [Streptomonospora salina]|uniref:Uncharacterized protein n=1 Tax=Streptomonospora salina TaxID=104205 RepID=A0A841EB67_9ACTN|nr:hypothetical protein [Streptomonospora salina]MBB6000262.1 hypothetical protein [Streptomonospora salina]